MNTSNPFERLAQQARRGDQQARAQLVRELAPNLARMVKHADSGAGPRGPMLERLQAVARRLADSQLAPTTDAGSVAGPLGRYIAGQFCPAMTEVCGGTKA